MKKTVYLLMLLSISAFSQSKYLTKTGTVTFEASVPSFEEVAAKNNSTTAILNTENGEFAALVLIKGFRFKNALMEEHFNENYAESDDYPKATFKGKISNFTFENINSSETTLIYSGTLSFHGETKSLENLILKITLNEESTIRLSGSFSVEVSDFNIKIPKVVRNKLSNTVNATFDFELSEK